MVLLSPVIFLIFLSVKHAFVISTIGSNVTINLTVPQKGTTGVTLNGGHLLFETDLRTSPKVAIYNDDRISNVSYQSGGNVQFILHNISEEDAGNYVCQGDQRDVIPDCGEWLIVSLNPATPVIQKKSIPNKDGSLVLSCNSSSRSLPKNHNLTMIFSWKRNGEILSSNTTTEIKGSDIRINHLNRSDNGDNFSCQAEEILGLKSEWSRPLMLILEYGPEDIHFDPNKDIINVVEGGNTEIRCFTDCEPDCTVVWWDRDRQKVINSGEGESFLNIRDVSRNTSRHFQCSGHNTYGNRSRNIALYVNNEEADARDNDGLKEEGYVKGVVSVIDDQVLLSIVMTALAVMIVVSVIFGVKYRKMKEKSGRERYAAYLTPLSNRESDERNANDDNNGYATIKDDGDGYATIKDDNNGYVTINDDNKG